MNKKFKIVSSIALAGMLLTGSLGMNKVNAVETIDVTTNPVAVYRKLVEGKTVVPFVLANKADKLTVKDITESEMFRGKVETVNGNVVSSLETEVGTGDKFTTTDGTEYTIIVYGDVDGDGKISSGDAYLVEQYRSGMIDLNDVQREAADIGENDGSVNSGDSYAIKAYRVDFIDDLITNLPPKEEVVEDSNYSATLNDGGYINNQNVSTSKLAVTLKETLDEGTTLRLVVSDSVEETDDIDKEVEIPAHTDYVEFVEFKDKSAINFSSLANGTITGKLYDGDKIVATFETVKNIETPEVANVRANRVSTKKATLSLEGMGATKVTKIEYTIKDEENEEVTKGSIDVNDNKVTDATIAEDLKTDKVYKLYYTIENEFGSRTGEIGPVTIASDSASVTALTKLDAVNAPDLTDLTENPNANFTFDKNDKDEESHDYIATLYKDGVVVAEKETSAEEVSFKDEMSGVGTYKVSVIVKGTEDGLHTNSEATVSEEVTVSQLKAVEDLTLQNEEEGKVVLSWSNPNGKDDFGAYQITLYKLTTEGKEDSVKTIECANDQNEVEVTGLESNTIYFAKVKLQAKGNQMATIDSEEVTSNQFYRVEAPDVETAKLGSTSIEFTVQPINIPNKDVTYKIEVYNVNTPYDPTIPDYVLDKDATGDITIGEDNKVVVDGLDPATQYAFRLVATVDGNEVKSGYTSPVATIPVFDSVVVSSADEARKENSNKVAVEGTKIILDGAKYETTGVENLEAAFKVINSLKAGDVVTMNDGATEVSIELVGEASGENHIRDFGTDTFANSTVEITSNDYNKTIIGTFKSLTLKGTDSIFTLDDAEVTNDIVLTDGVEVTSEASKEYKVEAGATAIINDLKVTTDEELTLTANSGKNIIIDANKSSNDLVFENTTEGNANIEFLGDPDNTSEQKGKVTIKSNGGIVTVTSDKVNVSAEMKVEVNKGTVDIQDPSLTGDKTVTISADEGESKVVARTEISAPRAIDGKELKEYTDDEIRDTFGIEKQEEVIAMREYINSFGLNGTGATIKVEAEDLGVATITLTDSAQNVTIGNLK